MSEADDREMDSAPEERSHDGEGETKDGMAISAARPENVVHLKRHPRKTNRKRVLKTDASDSDPELCEDSADTVETAGNIQRKAKRARASDEAEQALNTGLTFQQVKQLVDDGEKLEVWWRLPKDPAVVRWRADCKAVHEDSETFDVRAIEHGVDVRGVAACRLAKRTALAV